MPDRRRTRRPGRARPPIRGQRTTAKTHPGVVLLDLKLPRIDGLDVLKRIRTEKRTQRVPVVILTSSSEAGDLIRAHDLGANSYVCKPIQLKDFTTTA